MRVSCPTSNIASELVGTYRARHLGAAIVVLFQTGITQLCGKRQAPIGQNTMLRFPSFHFFDLGPLSLHQRASDSATCKPAEVVIGGWA